MRAVLALGVWLCLVQGERAAGQEPPAPLAWQEPGGLQRLFLQLPFEAPTVAGPGTFEGELRLIYSSSILVEAVTSASIDVNLETAQFTGFLRYGLVPGVELELAVPVSVDYGGFLGGFIQSVEGLFDAVNPDRRDRPRNLCRFRVNNNGAVAWVDGPEAGIGDVWIGAKDVLLGQRGAWPAVALRAALKFPTGRYPFGSGELDGGGSLFLGWTLDPVAVRLQVDGMTPTATLRVLGISTRPYGAAQAGVAVSPSDSIALHLQLSATTSPLEGTGLEDIDWGARYVLLGLSYRASRSWELEFGAVENVFSQQRGVDFAFFLAGRGKL
jgi:hypothetical protein